MHIRGKIKTPLIWHLATVRCSSRDIDLPLMLTWFGVRASRVRDDATDNVQSRHPYNIYFSIAKQIWARKVMAFSHSEHTEDVFAECPLKKNVVCDRRLDMSCVNWRSLLPFIKSCDTDFTLPRASLDFRNKEGGMPIIDCGHLWPTWQKSNVCIQYILVPCSRRYKECGTLMSHTLWQADVTSLRHKQSKVGLMS